MQISPLLRQFLVVVSPQLAAFSVGGAVTYPSVLIDHYSSNDSSVHLDVDTKSWIGSMYGLSGIPVVLMPIVTQMIGRKYGYIMSCLYVVVGWILTYNATNPSEILISEFFHGLGINSLLPVSFVAMSEMLAPKYRLVSMQAFGISQSLGMAAGGIIGRFFHFKIVCIIMFVPIVLAIAIALIWPESPSWFACKGDFEKCRHAFILLRGSDEQSAKELSDIITAQKENLSVKETKMTLNALWNQVTSRDFYIPTLHTFIMINMMYWGGSDVVLIYFMEMASKSTSNTDATFYAAIVMYVIVVVGMVLTDLLVIKFNNKTVLLMSTCGFTLFLTCACMITGLQSLDILHKNSMLCVYFLLLCMAMSCLGLTSLVFIISAELMPVKHRSIGGALYIVINCMLYASSQKLAPYLFLCINLWGSFLLYAVNASLCALFVWKYVPETKGRSLQEIEDFYKYGKFIERTCDEETELITS